MYRLYRKILGSFPGDFRFWVKIGIFLKNFRAHFLESP